MRRSHVCRLSALFLILTITLIIYGGISRPRTTRAATPIPALTLGTDPADWPVITTENAQDLMLKGVYGHGNNRQALWAADGHTLIVGGDRGVWLYDVRTPDAPPVALDEPDLPVISMAVSHDGKSLAVSAGEARNGYGIGRSIRVWDISTRALRVSIATDTLPILFSVDDTQIIGFGLQHGHMAPGMAAIWDAKTGQVLATASSADLFSDFYDNKSIITAIARFGLRLQLLATINSSGNIGIWSIPPQVPNRYEPSDNLLNLPFNRFITVFPDKQLMTINLANHWFWVFDLNKGLLDDVIDISSLNSKDLSISSDGKTRVTIEKGAVTLRNSRTNSLVGVLPGQTITDFAVSYDNRSVALVNGGKVVDVVDVGSGKTRFSLPGQVAPIAHILFSPNGKWIVTASQDQTVRLWDSRNGQPGRIWHTDDSRTVIAFSPDSQFLAISGAKNAVRLWDVNTGQFIKGFYGPEGTGFGLRFNSSTLLSMYSGSVLVQWNLQAFQSHTISLGDKIHFGGHTHIIQVSPDGLTSLALSLYGCEGPSLLIFDNATGQVINDYYDCAFTDTLFGYSPDGKLIVSVIFTLGADRSTVCITNWGRTFNKCLDNIDGNQKFGRADFSPSGRLLAALNSEGVLVIWGIGHYQ